MKSDNVWAAVLTAILTSVSLVIKAILEQEDENN